MGLGLATGAILQNTCTNTCTALTTDPYAFQECSYFCYEQEMNTRGTCSGCGPKSGDATTASGAVVRVPITQDNFWSTPPNPSSLSSVQQWLDGSCASDRELFGVGVFPINGVLRDMKRYFAGTWASPDGALSYPSPLAAEDLACRPLHVILIMDGDENCDTQQDAVDAATDMFQNGVTVGGKNFKIRTHVINFAGATQANADAIANAGDTGTAHFASNETELLAALRAIMTGALSAETCDNVDNNCNGCTDEGFRHYCDVGKTCCSWATPAQRSTCLSNFQASITAAAPLGNQALLPCTTAQQQTDPTAWLCFNPGEACDEIDNNCQDGTDESLTKCGNPLHCPTTETCNGQDDNCNGVADEGCGVSCVPTAEVCDGCDNDCNGVADDGASAVPCGLTNPAYCQGTRACAPPTAVPAGGCVAGGGYQACSNNPQAETCDGVDNNCNGIVDDYIVAVACLPSGAPPGLNYGGNSECKLGQTHCVNGNTVCVGWVGPRAEVCDGVDNDCDGTPDESPAGVGQPCGNNLPPCSPGFTACINGAMTCVGGTAPQPEVCDGIDNDCDGAPDDAPLADAPLPGRQGCWLDSGNACSHGNLAWQPPPGAGCFDEGSLAPPCRRGELTCSGAGGWSCQGARGPTEDVCDGLDNNCDGIPDNVPETGTVCGTDEGECFFGTTACFSGVFYCSGSVSPIPEACDGLDNDCDAITDEDIASATCTATYDTAMYPGARTGGACRPGLTACTSPGFETCAGAVGPTPEVCDGVDNDCDGQTDEPGFPPDGTDATASPLDPARVLGAACGLGALGCGSGTLVCERGLVRCVGAGTSTEVCDDVDNDCDGSTDEASDGVCPASQACVTASGATRCAVPCGAGVDCPTGQICVASVNSETGAAGSHCVPGGSGAGVSGAARVDGISPDVPDRVDRCACADVTTERPWFAAALLLVLGALRTRRSGKGVA
ncbi:MAG: MopE-related protein [Myxococcota bacterium]